MFSGFIRSGSLDIKSQHFLSFQECFQPVADLHGAYAGGCTCEQIVAGAQGYEPGDIGDQGIYREDHVAGIALLHGVSVQGQTEAEVARVGDVAYRHKAAHGCGEVERLGLFPGQPFFLCLLLQVAGSEIDTQRQGIVIGMCELRADMSAYLADPVHQLAFVMQVVGEFGIIEGPVADQQGCVGLDEKDWFRRYGIVELFRMLTVVPSDTDDFHCWGAIVR